MEKPKQILIKDFSRGITTDSREDDFRYSQFIQGFEAHTYPHKLVPVKSTESGDSSASTSKKENFCLAELTAGVYKLYALGVVSGQIYAEILYKAFTTSNSSDLSDATWLNTANNQSASGAINSNLFAYYKKATAGNTGLIFFSRNGSHIGAYDPTGSAAIADTHYAVTHTHIGQGITHSKDDRFYVPYYDSATGTGGVLMKNSSSAFVVGIATAKYLIPISVCEYGNYLAIACQPASGIGKSVVFLWDRDTSTALFSETIDFGDGILQILEQISGYLVGISYTGVAPGNLSSLLGRFTFRYYAGGTPVIFRELLSEATFTAGDLPLAKQKISQSLYFLMTVTLGGTKRQGVWRISRAGENTPFSLVMETPANNGTALTSGLLKGFFKVGDYMFLAYTDNSVYKVDKTDDSGSAYTAMSSTYETLKFGDAFQNKKLVVVGVMTEPLPSAGEVILKYKKDEDSSWTTIFDNTTNDNMYRESVNIESTGVTLPEFKEIQFQILSTGNAVITGLYAKYEIIDNQLT